LRGAVIGLQPLVELAIMPFCVTLGGRVGFLWLMCIGAAFGMFAAQILMGGVWVFSHRLVSSLHSGCFRLLSVRPLRSNPMAAGPVG
jgi:hypothetical protein